MYCITDFNCTIGTKFIGWRGQTLTRSNPCDHLNSLMWSPRQLVAIIFIISGPRVISHQGRWVASYIKWPEREQWPHQVGGWVGWPGGWAGVTRGLSRVTRGWGGVEWGIEWGIVSWFVGNGRLDPLVNIQSQGQESREVLVDACQCNWLQCQWGSQIVQEELFCTCCLLFCRWKNMLGGEIWQMLLRKKWWKARMVKTAWVASPPPPWPALDALEHRAGNMSRQKT